VLIPWSAAAAATGAANRHPRPPGHPIGFWPRSGGGLTPRPGRVGRPRWRWGSVPRPPPAGRYASAARRRQPAAAPPAPRCPSAAGPAAPWPPDERTAECSHFRFQVIACSGPTADMRLPALFNDLTCPLAAGPDKPSHVLEVVQSVYDRMGADSCEIRMNFLCAPQATGGCPVCPTTYASSAAPCRLCRTH